MMDLIYEIEEWLEDPHWANWHFHTIKHVIDPQFPEWAVYISYDDGGDPRGLSIVTRADDLEEALREMLLVVSEQVPDTEPWG